MPQHILSVREQQVSILEEFEEEEGRGKSAIGGREGIASGLFRRILSEVDEAKEQEDGGRGGWWDSSPFAEAVTIQKW